MRNGQYEWEKTGLCSLEWLEIEARDNLVGVTKWHSTTHSATWEEYRYGLQGIDKYGSVLTLESQFGHTP